MLDNKKILNIIFKNRQEIFTDIIHNGMKFIPLQSEDGECHKYRSILSMRVDNDNYFYHYLTTPDRRPNFPEENYITYKRINYEKTFNVIKNNIINLKELTNKYLNWKLNDLYANNSYNKLNEINNSINYTINLINTIAEDTLTLDFHVDDLIELDNRVLALKNNDTFHNLIIQHYIDELILYIIDYKYSIDKQQPQISKSFNHTYFALIQNIIYSTKIIYPDYNIIPIIDVYTEEITYIDGDILIRLQPGLQKKHKLSRWRKKSTDSQMSDSFICLENGKFGYSYVSSTNGYSFGEVINTGCGGFFSYGSSFDEKPSFYNSGVKKIEFVYTDNTKLIAQNHTDFNNFKFKTIKEILIF